MELSAQGGMTSAMGAVIHGIASAVATVEGSDADLIRQDILERLAICIVRANARAVTRKRVVCVTAVAAQHRQLCAAAKLLEEVSCT